MPEHTPGPLTVVRAAAGENWFCIEIQDTPGNCIAQVYWDEGENYPNVEQTEANARLIAAAPDLLEACKLAIPKMCYACRAPQPCTTGAGMCSLAEAANAVRAAIAKAEGEKKWTDK